jgi:hypothetical protein
MAGRPASITPEIQAEIIACISDGLSRGGAARCTGTTLRSIKRLEKRDAAFRHSLKKAEAMFERTHLKRIASGCQGWQSSSWLLERKLWMRYSVVKREPPQAKEPDLPDNDPPALG